MIPHQRGVSPFPLPWPPKPARQRAPSRRCSTRFNLRVCAFELLVRTITALNFLYFSYSTTYTNDNSNNNNGPNNNHNNYNRHNVNDLPRRDNNNQDFISDSFPRHRNSSFSYFYSLNYIAGPPPSSLQADIVERLNNFCVRFVRRLGLKAMRGVDPNNAFPPTDAWPAFLYPLPVNPRTTFLSMSGAEASAGAVPIVAAKVALPESTKCVDLLSLLPADIAAKYASPDQLLLPALPGPVKRRAPSFFGEAKEYPLLVRRLLSANMVVLSRERPKVINGLFATPKSHPVFTLRLIFHGQPVNDVMVEPPKVNLPSVDLLSSLIADPTRDLWLSKTDLSNFYHQLALPAPLLPYFGLPPLPVDSLGLPSAELEQYPVGATVFPLYCRLPMGWSHSVFLAQTAHEHQVALRTSRPLADRILWSRDRLLDRHRDVIYIDDKGDFGQDPVELKTAQDEYVAAFDRPPRWCQP